MQGGPLSPLAQLLPVSRTPGEARFLPVPGTPNRPLPCCRQLGEARLSPEDSGSGGWERRRTPLMPGPALVGGWAL